MPGTAWSVVPTTDYFYVNLGTIKLVEIELSNMKTLSLIVATFFLLFGAVSSRGAVLTRISDETGVPVDTLQAERASTGLGYGELENAHLLANASGQSFDDIVAMYQAGEGWGKIAHDNGLNLGRIVSDAHRSNQAALHAQNANAQNAHGQNVHAQSTHGKSSSVHGKSTTAFGKGHASTMKGVGHGRGGKSGGGALHGMVGMGHGHGGH